MLENISTNLNEQHKYISSISTDETEDYPNELTIKTIEEAERGIGMSRTFDSIEEFMKDLMDDA